jgi:anti-sigma B factor antagonist
MDTIQISSDTRGGWHVVTVKGRVDGITSDSLEAALNDAVKNHDQVAVDCSGIDYISSAGLRSLLQGARDAQMAGHKFVLCSPSARAKSVFDISRMQLVMTIQEGLPC